MLRYLLIYILFPICAYPQSVEVTGQIVSADNRPVPGANILVKGTSIGTVADANGLFRLLVPAQTTTLIFAYSGYKILQRKITCKSGIRYQLTVTLIDQRFPMKKSALTIKEGPVK